MRPRVLAEADDVVDAGLACQLAEQLEVRIVAVEDRIAAGLDSLEDLRLCAAMSSKVLNYPRWPRRSVVMMATCGRTMLASGGISPALFMPISKTPKSHSLGMRASVSGTPQ